MLQIFLKIAYVYIFFYVASLLSVHKHKTVTFPLSSFLTAVTLILVFILYNTFHHIFSKVLEM